MEKKEKERKKKGRKNGKKDGMIKKKINGFSPKPCFKKILHGYCKFFETQTKN